MPPIDDPRVQPALDAMLGGDASRLAELLDRKPELSAERWGDNTLLEWTTQPPHGVANEVVDVLIAHSPNLDRALGLAGCWDLPDLCVRLIDAGADVTARADAGITPLESAAMHSSTRAADVLAEHGLHRHSLWLAAAAGMSDLVSDWVSEDGVLTRSAGEYRPNWADVGRPVAEPPGSNDGTLIDEAFVFACLNGRLEIAQLLLDRGAAVNGGPYANTTALHFAIQFQQLDAVRFLLDRGASIEVEDDVHGSTALGWARACHRPERPVTAEILSVVEAAS